MPRNNAGTYALPSNSFNPAIVDTDIDPDAWNATGADLAEALTQSIAFDGQTQTIARIPFANGISVVGGAEADDISTTTLEVSGAADFSGPVNLGGGKSIGDTFISGATVTGVSAVALSLTGFTTFLLKISAIDPVTANAALQVQFSTDGGSTWGAATEYDYAGQTVSQAGTATAFGGTAAAAVLVSSVGLGNSAGFNHSVDVRVNIDAGENPVAVMRAWLSDQAGNLYSVQSGGRRRVTSCNAVRFLFSSGNIATATYALHGLTG